MDVGWILVDLMVLLSDGIVLRSATVVNPDYVALARRRTAWRSRGLERLQSAVVIECHPEDRGQAGCEDVETCGLESDP
jgi:hypothetical protein